VPGLVALVQLKTEVETITSVLARRFPWLLSGIGRGEYCRCQDLSAASPSIFFLAHPTNNLSKREIEREKQKVSVTALQIQGRKANELFVFHLAYYENAWNV
jgi:hypothetical protein